MIPGSPAPAIFRKQQQERELQQLTSDTQPSMPGSPKITLSRCKDDEVQKFNIPQFEDTMLEVRINSLNMDIEIKEHYKNEKSYCYTYAAVTIFFYLGYECRRSK